MSVIIYVEGGGVGDPSLTKCRMGFVKFFERLLPGKYHVKVMPCGGRNDAWKDFELAHRSRKPGEHIMLLVDSEGPVEWGAVSPWDYLQRNDNWEKPEHAEDDQVHLMVQCMEAWFMADRETVVKYFGEGLKIGHLPAPVNNDVESIPREKIRDALGKAAKRFHKARGAKKQGYHKVQDGFTLLALIDPKKVCGSSRCAGRLRDTLVRKLPDRR